MLMLMHLTRKEGISKKEKKRKEKNKTEKRGKKDNKKRLLWAVGKTRWAQPRKLFPQIWACFKFHNLVSF